MPGTGHLYHDQPTIGWAVIALEVGLAAGALGFHLEGRAEEKHYREDTVGSVPHREQAEEAYGTRNTLLWAFGAVYLAQLVHLALITPEAVSPTASSPQTTRGWGWSF
ncbi:MAG: hypothetical protein ACE366_21205 [Bradymonadia bacterium]